MFRANFQRTNASEVTALRHFQGIKWTAKKTYGFSFTLDQNSEILYVLTLSEGAETSVLEALNTQNGQLVWSLRMTGYTRPRLLLHEDVLYVTGRNGYVCAVDTQSRQFKWNKEIGFSFNSDVVVIGEVLCFSDTASTLYGLNRETGDIIWSFNPIEDVKMTPLSAFDGRVYVGSSNGSLYALDASTGQVVWQTDTGILHKNSIPVIGNNKVYIENQSRNTLIIDISSGKIMQQVRICSDSPRSPSFLAVKDEIAYLDNNNGYFCAFDTNKCRELWKINTRKYLAIRNFVISDSAIYIACFGALYALDLSTGEELWKFTPPDPKIWVWIMDPKLWPLQFINLTTKFLIGAPVCNIFDYPPIISNGAIYTAYMAPGNLYLYALH
jgi:outer membrane protein assembly factor BamB